MSLGRKFEPSKVLVKGSCNLICDTKTEAEGKEKVASKAKEGRCKEAVE